MQEYVELSATQYKIGIVALGLLYFVAVAGAVVVIRAPRTISPTTNSTLSTSPNADVVTQSASTEDANESLVASFPAFPVYPGATIESSRKQPNGIPNVTGYSAVWHVTGNQDVATVASWYRSELTKLGWTVADPSTENASLNEQDLHATRSKQSAAIIIEKGEDTDKNTIEILVDIPAE